MIFASDLDQTLIYSENFLGKHYTNPAEVRDLKLSLIEYYQGKPLSYLHNDVIDILKTIDKQQLFVPVTTRTEEQYKRIEWHRFDIHPKYAITTNGAKVLVDGEIDQEWQKRIDRKRSALTLSQRDLENVITEVIPTEAIKKIRTAEEMFTYCVLFREKLNGDEVARLQEQLTPQGIQVSLQGTKIYFMPHIFSKGEAFKYVAEKLGVAKSMGAGDSLLDLSLLSTCDLGIIPTHGEIYLQQLQEEYKLHVCKSKGVENSVEITQKALENLS